MMNILVGNGNLLFNSKTNLPAPVQLRVEFVFVYHMYPSWLVAASTRRSKQLARPSL